VALSIVAGGGLMLVLSGSALADNGSSTTSQTVSNQSASQTVYQDSSGSSSTTIETSQTATSGGATTDSTGSKPADLAVAGTITAPPASQPGAPLDSAVHPAAPTTGGDAPTNLPPAAAAQTDPPAGPSATPGSIAFNALLLPIQPRITPSHPAVINDLAAMMPTDVRPNGPAKAPAPVPSSGLFGALSATLAGSVVGVFTVPPFGRTALAVALTLLVSLMLLCTARPASTFAAILRRGGYAQAARSDVASAAIFTFATPLNLSYAAGVVPVPSSFLMVSDIKSMIL